ncbi:uncharacterized protein [Clytia hemisphaerica]
MSGRRRQRSSTIGDGLDKHDDFSEPEYHTEDESCFYRPLGRSQNHSSFRSGMQPRYDQHHHNQQRHHHQQHQLLDRKSSSVMDLRSTSDYCRPPPDSTMLYNSRALKRLSIKPELDEDEGNISDHSTTSSASYSGTSLSGSFSGSPQMQKRIIRSGNFSQRGGGAPPIKHAQSMDNIFSSRTYEHESRGNEYLFGSTMQRRSAKRIQSTKRAQMIKMKSFDELLSSKSTSNLTTLSSSTRLGHLGSGPRRASTKTNTPSANLMTMRNNLMTSSYRNLADRNVRENPAFAEPTKTLRTSSPYLERRLAEAKERQSKRSAALKNLDTDFDKAKAIIKKYKSNENLLSISNKDNGLVNGDSQSEDKDHYHVI